MKGQSPVAIRYKLLILKNIYLSFFYGAKIGILGLNDCYNNEDWYINNFSFKNVKDNIVDFLQVNMETKEDIFNFYNK